MERRRLASRGLLFVVSAPSGCGKTTICKRLISTLSRLSWSVSFTTRPRRNNEVDGKHYCFVSKKEFLKRRKRGEFLEWACNFGYLYGTSKRVVGEILKSGKDVLLTIDVKGAKKIKKAVPKSIHIFLMPPSIMDLEKRLKKRGTDTQRDIEKRLNISKREITQAKKYDYTVVNESIKNAVSRLKSIVQTERRKRIL